MDDASRSTLTNASEQESLKWYFTDYSYCCRMQQITYLWSDHGSTNYYMTIFINYNSSVARITICMQQSSYHSIHLIVYCSYIHIQAVSSFFSKSYRSNLRVRKDYLRYNRVICCSDPFLPRLIRIA